MTKKELLFIENQTDDILYQVKTAADLLNFVWNRYFADIEQAPLNSYQAREVGLEINTATDKLFEAIRDWHLVTGTEGQCTEAYLEKAMEYRNRRRTMEESEQADRGPVLL